MVSRLLDGTNSTDHLIDIESGTARAQEYPVRERTGGLQLGSVIHQLDSILSAGLPFLRRNPKALISALVYVAILHIWVMYIFFSKWNFGDIFYLLIILLLLFGAIIRRVPVILSSHEMMYIREDSVFSSWTILGKSSWLLDCHL